MTIFILILKANVHAFLDVLRIVIILNHVTNKDVIGYVFFSQFWFYFIILHKIIF